MKKVIVIGALEASDLVRAYSCLFKRDRNISEVQHYSNIFVGRLISSQERIDHLRLTRPKDFEYDLLTNGDAQLEIEYKSIYNEKWHITGISGLPERVE